MSPALDPKGSDVRAPYLLPASSVACALVAVYTPSQAVPVLSGRSAGKTREAQHGTRRDPAHHTPAG
jgi:hypothetical protein